ncbi:Flagellum-specific ATP synthase [Thalassocella blandensis]|nr:Flagellum-specific ATP synthase [Thalassocella blandensis]
MIDELPYIDSLAGLRFGRQTGKLTAIHGGVIEASGCDVHQGQLVEIIQAKGGSRIKAEVVGLRDKRILLMPFSDVHGLCLNSTVVPLDSSLKVPVGNHLLGRVVDAMGAPLDRAALPAAEMVLSSYAEPINPLDRTPINETLSTGVKAIDVFCTLGRGQRIGIMAGSGVGKSTLLGMMAKHTDADVIVIALIGERGREVGDFIRESLGEDGLKRSVVVVASAEQPAVLRRQAAYTATTIAEWFRDKNKNVLLIMDSITRFAMAQREIGLSTGEPIGSRGYPSSVFSLLPPLLERGGTLKNKGTITSIYTVLVEGDDINEPVADHMRSILDGHVMLSRELAALGHYPAIDIQNSISRLASSLLEAKESSCIKLLRESLAIYSSSRDLIDLGAYEPGRNQQLDKALKLKPELDKLVTQNPSDTCQWSQTWKHAFSIVNTREQIDSEKAKRTYGE